MAKAKKTTKKTHAKPKTKSVKGSAGKVARKPAAKKPKAAPAS